MTHFNLGLSVVSISIFRFHCPSLFHLKQIITRILAISLFISPSGIWIHSVVLKNHWKFDTEMGNSVSANSHLGPQVPSPEQSTPASMDTILREREDDSLSRILEKGDEEMAEFGAGDLVQRVDTGVKMDYTSSESESPREYPTKSLTGSLNGTVNARGSNLARLKVGPYIYDRKQYRQNRLSFESSSSKESANSTSPESEIKTARSSSRSQLSNSNSFEEKFKNKVSIYSKVSGCRMTNLPELTIIKQIRVVILEYITKGNVEEALLIKFAYEKMKNGGLQIITDDKRLSDALSSLSYFATIPCKMTFPNNPRVVGFVKNLPVDMEPAELKQEIRKELPEIYSVRYITERAAGRSRPSQGPCAFISFNLRYLPGSIWVYGKEHEIRVPNPMQCSRCCRYGHQGKQCRAMVKCSLCGSPHSKHQCGSSVLRCVNCKGAHPSTSHECPVWEQGKLMNELRYRGGLTAEEAINVASQGKIEHKKHSFVAPDEYFDNLESFYLGNGSGDGPEGSDEDDVTMNHAGVNTLDETFVESAPKYFHYKYIEAQQFLDLMTDFYLRLTNPDGNYTSAMLMPLLDEDSMLIPKNQKKPSMVAEQFKQCVLQAAEVDGKEVIMQPSVLSS